MTESCGDAMEQRGEREWPLAGGDVSGEVGRMGDTARKPAALDSGG